MTVSVGAACSAAGMPPGRSVPSKSEAHLPHCAVSTVGVGAADVTVAVDAVQGTVAIQELTRVGEGLQRVAQLPLGDALVEVRILTFPTCQPEVRGGGATFLTRVTAGLASDA